MTTRRSNEVDFIRMAALIGICLVNVPFMALPLEQAFNPPDSLPDRFGAFFVAAFVQLKFFIFFSFVFGWGMAIQARLALSSGQSFAKRYFRRMAGLALFGLAHATLVFSGDILLLYALLGSLLWLVKDCSPAQLMKLAAWMLPLSLLMLGIIAVLYDSAMADKAITLAAEASAGLGGNFAEATRTRIMDWPATFGLLVFMQGPLAFGAFAAGLAAAKTDFFTPDSVGFKRLEKRLPLLLAVALPLNSLYGAVMVGLLPESWEVLSLLGFVLIAVGAPALTLVYLYLFIRLSRVIRVPQLLVLAGRNSLSSYIAQGVLAGFVFGAYGLGLFNSLGQAALIPVALAIALGAMLLVGICAQVFGRGPLEPILREISGS